MRLLKPTLVALISLYSATATFAQYHKDYTYSQKNYSVQALLGAVKYDDLQFENTDGTNDTTYIDMSLIPQLGGAWSTLPEEKPLQFGLEATFLLGFKFDKVNYASVGGSGAYVSISTSMWMFDLAGGGYVNFRPTNSIRLYAAGGPLLMFADYKSDKDYDDATPDTTSHESAFGLGLYARTGLEFKVTEDGYLGLGARWNWSNVDFTEVGGSSKVYGLAGFITFTAGL